MTDPKPEDEEGEPLWWEYHLGTLDVHLRRPYVRICTGYDQVVEVDKLYGPRVADPVRVSLDLAANEWVIEQAFITLDEGGDHSNEWREVARFPSDRGIESKGKSNGG